MNKKQRAEIEENGIIATNLANLPLIALVYGIAHFECNELYARIGSMRTDANNSAEKAPLKRYAIQTDKDERDFFTGCGHRFYLDETNPTPHGHGW